jgi:hypothetical protein
MTLVKLRCEGHNLLQASKLDVNVAEGFARAMLCIHTILAGRILASVSLSTAAVEGLQPCHCTARTSLATPRKCTMYSGAG